MLFSACLVVTLGNRDSVLGIATGYRLDDWGFGARVPVGSKVSSSIPALGSAQAPMPWVPGAFFPGIKRSGREADHSPWATAEVKKMCIYTSTPPTPSWRRG
jgi:hypothetical protein